MDKVARAVAVVGLGAILPDAPDAPTFWETLKFDADEALELRHFGLCGGNGAS